MTLPAQESLRPAARVAPSNTGRLRPRSDGSFLPLAHSRFLAQPLGWLVDEVQRKRFELFSHAIGGLNAMALVPEPFSQGLPDA